ncbi:MAG: hypothetical protein A3G24_18180 [Betaproteobacteria bacterium RIFCSPLOWO2_12_FULL_62_13]|nr:MAG: hypothetical protein A3G24_18180 [Betaproteobacteria bacterium RIFCSPLOWO2_12_FULL_62_13]
MERGLGDGLPIVPPSVRRVEQVLAYCARPWEEPLAQIPPRYGEATPIRLAANAVMAGCRPEYFPLLMLAIEAMCEEKFNLYGVQATTHLCAPLVIVNGPVATELGINSGHNAFGPGTHSNATIGRAIRLALLNIGGAIPKQGDMATFGSPAKYSYLVAENEAASPWEPLHVERGFPADASTVTVVGAECPHNVNDHESLTAEGILTTFAGTMLNAGTNDVCYEAQPVAVFGPEHARTVAQDGYAKADVKRFLQEHAQLPLGRFSKENIERRLRVKLKERYATASLDALVPMVQRAEDIIIVVIGGAGKHSAFIPTFGATQSVTRALKRRDGEYARSVEELRCG